MFRVWPGAVMPSVLAAQALLGCSKDPTAGTSDRGHPGACKPDQVEPCACGPGIVGVSTCLASGAALGPCNCPAPAPDSTVPSPSSSAWPNSDPVMAEPSPKEPIEPPPLDFRARNLRIAEVAIYQAVKIPLVRDGHPVVERNAPVVEGKDAFLSVFLQPMPGFAPRELEIELTLRSATSEVRSLVVRQLVRGESVESELDSTINFDIPGASITRELSWSVMLREVDPVAVPGTIDDGARYPQGGELQALHPRYVGPLRVMLVPYRYNADGSGRLPDLEEDQLRRYRAFLTRYYPFSEVVFEVHEPVDYEHPVDPESGWNEFLDLHCALRTRERPDRRVFYHGLIAPAIHGLAYADGSGGQAFIPGPADDDRCSVGLGFSGGVSAIVLTHELGHAFGLRHAPCNADDAGPYPYEDAKIGSWGFDFPSRTLMAPESRYDLMSLCDPVFISDYTYQKVFERLRYLNLQFDQPPESGGFRDDALAAALSEQAAAVGTRCGVGLPVPCALGTEKCCVRSLATDSCMDASAPCTCAASGCTTLEMSCDGPEDCDQGQVCCGTLQDSSSPEYSLEANRYTEFSCQASCDYAGSQRIACHSVDPECPVGTLCANSQLLSNVQICIDPATIFPEAAQQ